MQRMRLTKTVIYLRVFIIMFTLYTFLYGVKRIYGLSTAMQLVLLSVLVTTVGAGALLLYYGTFALKHELRRKCGCYISCSCEK